MMPRSIDAIPLPISGTITAIRFFFGLGLVWLATLVLTKEQGGYLVEAAASKLLERHPDAPERFAQYLRGA